MDCSLNRFVWGKFPLEEKQSCVCFVTDLSEKYISRNEKIIKYLKLIFPSYTLKYDPAVKSENTVDSMFIDTNSQFIDWDDDIYIHNKNRLLIIGKDIPFVYVTRADVIIFSSLEVFYMFMKTYYDRKVEKLKDFENIIVIKKFLGDKEFDIGFMTQSDIE